MKLQRRFTPLQLLMISINGMVGSAWLFAPLYAAKIAGGGAIIAWLIGGVATALIALTFAELSVLFPVAGGTAQIPRISHGAMTSFVLSWIAWLSAVTMAPIEVQAVLQYASTIFPTLTHLENGVPVLTGLGYCWAAVLMLGLCALNVASFKGLVGFNFLLFLFKTIVIVVAVGALLNASFHPSNFAGLTHWTSVSGWQAILSAVASGGIAFAFTGFKHGVELAGEAKDVKRAIPIATVGSVISCLLLYLGLQVAFIAALDPALLAKGWEHVRFVGDVGPFAGLAAGLGLFWLLKLLYVDAAVSPLGAGLIYVTSTARILYAMSELGFLPQAITRLNRQGFPVVAIGINFVVGMFLFLPLPGWQSMVEFLVSGMVISYAMGPIAVLCLRKDLPDAPRAFRLPLARVASLLAFYFCNLICYWTGWDTLRKLSIAIAFGFVLFAIALVRKKIEPARAGLRSVAWIVPYLGGLCLIGYLGAFGGKHIIPFGWDFLVIAFFSAVILLLAVKCRDSGARECYEAGTGRGDALAVSA